MRPEAELGMRTALAAPALEAHAQSLVVNCLDRHHQYFHNEVLPFVAAIWHWVSRFAPAMSCLTWQRNPMSPGWLPVALV